MIIHPKELKTGSASKFSELGNRANGKGLGARREVRKGMEESEGETHLESNHKECKDLEST